MPTDLLYYTHGLPISFVTLYRYFKNFRVIVASRATAKLYVWVWQKNFRGGVENNFFNPTIASTKMERKIMVKHAKNKMVIGLGQPAAYSIIGFFVSSALTNIPSNLAEHEFQGVVTGLVIATASMSYKCLKELDRLSDLEHERELAANVRSEV